MDFINPPSFGEGGYLYAFIVFTLFYILAIVALFLLRRSHRKVEEQERQEQERQEQDQPTQEEPHQGEQDNK